MQLIVAEKPSVARDLARVLGVRPSGQHCFEGDRCVITWCVGHLVELDEPASYDGRWKAWRLDTLPMLPGEFRLRAARHAGAQLRAVAKLLRDRRFATVVNACDAGREGELIFRYVYQFARGRPPVQRLWISSLTDDAIRRGFAALRPGARFDALADAARSRSEADWLVGMNATRAITVRGRDAGHGVLYSIGRVQTPTLAMLVERERAIAAFVPRPYWEVRGDFTTADGARFTAGWRAGKVSKLASAALADGVVARDGAHAAAADPVGPRVERVRAKTVREPPPLLFDLTSLQRTANRRFGFAAARTLEIAQALYERHKIVTYPRTDSRHLSNDVAGELASVFETLADVPEYAGFASALLGRSGSPAPRPGRRVVDDAKVHDHHAIIPTAKAPRLDALDRDERRLYDLIVRRFLGAFFPDAEFAVTEAWIRVGPGDAPAIPSGEVAPPPSPSTASDEPPILDALPPLPDRYFARGRVRIAAGWQEVAGIDPARARRSDGERDDADAAMLPALVEGQALDGTFAALAKQTTPPPRYTEATLLGAMESAGKAIDDEALRLAMKDRGLGTPATRAAIIETLLDRGYVARTGQQLVPTLLGAALIASLPVASLASPELTGTWEARLARIARGEETRDAFMADIARYVAEIVGAIRAADPPAAPPGASNAAPPRRGGWRGKRRGKSRFRSGARSTAPTWARKRDAKRRWRGDDARGDDPRDAVAGDDHTTSRSAPSDHPRDAIAGDDHTTSRSPRGRPSASSTRRSSISESRAAADRSVSTSAPARSASTSDRPGAPVALTCPRCGTGTLITGSRGWGCSRWRNGCRFVVWFQFAGRRLTPVQLRDLVTRGKTRKARFASEHGEVDGRLVLDAASDDTVRLERDR